MADQWQPIETAPKDKYILLGYFQEIGGGGPPTVACWNSIKGKWNDPGGFLNVEGYFSPTHWMPLPSPPTAS